MISRFSQRFLCLLLALVTLCMCCTPAMYQPAEAVAGIDDLTIAVGLSFLTWAGVSFATNEAARTATTSFLQSSVNGLKAASDVASKYVVDNTLALVQGVKDAFTSTLPDIQSTFQTAPGMFEGSLVGSTPLGVIPGLHRESLLNIKIQMSEHKKPGFPFLGSPVRFIQSTTHYHYFHPPKVHLCLCLPFSSIPAIQNNRTILQMDFMPSDDTFDTRF